MVHAADNTQKIKLNRYSLKAQGILGLCYSTPMFSGYWEQDPLSLKEESQLIAPYLLDGTLLTLPHSSVYEGSHQALLQMIHWLKDKIY